MITLTESVVVFIESGGEFDKSRQNSFVTISNNAIGIFRKYDKLIQVVLYNSGHISPYDVPNASLEMVKRLLDDRSFCKYSLPFNNTGGAQCDGVIPLYDGENLIAQCPNLCSGRGQCENSQCQCGLGYYEKDCSTARHDIYFGMEAIYTKNILFGNTIHLYHLSMPYSEIANGLFDIHVKLTKTSKLGKLHIYAFPIAIPFSGINKLLLLFVPPPEFN